MYKLRFYKRQPPTLISLNNFNGAITGMYWVDYKLIFSLFGICLYKRKSEKWL